MQKKKIYYIEFSDIEIDMTLRDAGCLPTGEDQDLFITGRELLFCLKAIKEDITYPISKSTFKKLKTLGKAAGKSYICFHYNGKK